MSYIIHSSKNFFDDIEITHSISARSMLIMVSALARAYGEQVDVLSIDENGSKCSA